jgi:hypothetical protein
MTRRIVLSCWGSFGDVFPYVGLARAIKARGHSPVVATMEAYRHTVEQAGVEFAPVGPEVDAADRDLIARLMHPAKGSEVIVRELMLPALAQSYEQLRHATAAADLLLTHTVTHRCRRAA